MKKSILLLLIFSCVVSAKEMKIITNSSYSTSSGYKTVQYGVFALDTVLPSEVCLLSTSLFTTASLTKVRYTWDDCQKTLDNYYSYFPQLHHKDDTPSYIAYKPGACDHSENFPVKKKVTLDDSSKLSNIIGISKDETFKYEAYEYSKSQILIHIKTNEKEYLVSKNISGNYSLIKAIKIQKNIHVEQSIKTFFIDGEAIYYVIYQYNSQGIESAELYEFTDKAIKIDSWGFSC